MRKIQPAFISYTQAISWLAFRDFDRLTTILNTITPSRWPIIFPNHKGSLLKALKALKKKRQWEAEEWAEEVSISTRTNTSASSHCVHYNKVVQFVESAKESLDQLIAELSDEMAGDAQRTASVEAAERDLLELFRNDKLELFGRKNGNGYSLKVPFEVLRLKHLHFNEINSELYEDGLFARGAKWTDLQIKRKPIVTLDAGFASNNKKPKYKAKPIADYLKTKSIIPKSVTKELQTEIKSALIMKNMPDAKTVREAIKIANA